jgi:hypothetical protein
LKSSVTGRKQKERNGYDEQLKSRLALDHSSAA